MAARAKRCVELLVPAGGEKQFIAAVENGADAVYVGGRSFNARINAGNFDDETMQAAIDYAHLRGVKVFVTMNILIKDEELKEALDYATFLYEAGADALIIQDLGLGSLIKEKLPDFELHLSTQATCCDARSLEAAAELGYRRVVPARELSLDEIRTLCEAKLCDIEVFVHGALCICYSGQCQLSRYYGGRSGNRGQCAQPCRLPYNSRDVHPLSPKDMCRLSDLGDLIEAGVYSFKIEGRMKSPEYVAVVTRIYRKYIDLYIETGSLTVSEEDMEELRQVFNRGRFTDAYLYGNPGDDLMSMVVPKNQGIEIGRVTGVKKNSTLVDVRLTGELSIGDGVEIRGGGRQNGNIVSYMKDAGGGITRIGDIRGDVRAGDTVYRTSCKNQLEDARRSFEGRSVFGDDRRPIRKRPVDMVLTGIDGRLILSIKTAARPDDAMWPSMRKVQVQAAAGPFEADTERHASRERLEGALGKLGSTPFELRRLDIRGDVDLRVKASELNDLRRRAAAELEEEMRFRRTAPGCKVEDAYERTAPDYEADARASGDHNGLSGSPMMRELYFFKLEDYLDMAEVGADSVPTGYERVLLPLAGMCLEADRRGESLAELAEELRLGMEIVPYISGVSKGLEDSIIEAHLADCLELARQTGISAGSLGWMRFFARDGVRVIAGFELNAYNRRTAEVLMELGAAEVTSSLETMEGGGVYPLMVSEHRFGDETYSSPMGHKLRVIKRPYSSQDVLVPIAEPGDGNRRYV
ncbi:MAG: U32 family peptidase [Anaerovoracaceae bacterium]